MGEEEFISKREARVTIRGLFELIKRIANPVLEPEEQKESEYDLVDEEANKEVVRQPIGLGEQIARSGV